MRRRLVRFAVIGCGLIGPVHARSLARLAPRAELALVVDRSLERAAELAGTYGAASSTSVEDAFRRDDIDAVAICTPSGSHADLAVAALRAGKHVVIEKPLDVSLDAARRVAEAERHSDRTVTVISQHRFDRSSQAVHEAIRHGRLGRVTSASASIPWWRSQRYYDASRWRGTWDLDGGGALMNQGMHTVDLLVWLLQEPVEVFAWAGRLAHERIEVEDTAVGVVRFASGALGAIHGTTAAYPGLSARLQVHGQCGSAVIEQDRLVYFHVAAGDENAPDLGARGGGNQAHELFPDQDEDVATAGSDPAALSQVHTDQYRDFLDAVAEGRPPLVTVAEATKTLAVVCAVYESVRTRRPIPVAI
jgi:UDP-N-acetyl-2-amino-2-deoxyglucuronate dehydrogenase